MSTVVVRQSGSAVAIVKLVMHGAWVVLGALFLTLGLFLVLPLMQAINKPPIADLTLQTLNTALLPPPPPVLEDEPEEEPEEEPEKPPELEPESRPLDLSQLELTLNPGFGSGWGGDFAINIEGAAGGENGVEALFSSSDLDQKPRVLYQPPPQLTEKMRRKTPGHAVVIFVVDRSGRPQSPRVIESSDPVFDRAALACVKQWKFEPGKRGGEPVEFRMRVPITFPKGR